MGDEIQCKACEPRQGQLLPGFDGGSPRLAGPGVLRDEESPHKLAKLLESARSS